jgi:hypothetical protein
MSAMDIGLKPMKLLAARSKIQSLIYAIRCQLQGKARKRQIPVKRNAQNERRQACRPVWIGNNYAGVIYRSRNTMVESAQLTEYCLHPETLDLSFHQLCQKEFNKNGASHD